MKVCVRELTVLAAGRQATSYSEETTVMISSFRTGAVALLVCALAAGACGKKPPAVSPLPPPPPVETPPTTPPPPPPRPPAPPTAADDRRPRTRSREGDARRAHQERRAEAGATSTYDSVVLTEEARGVLQKNVEYLKRRPTAKVMVEGHADSRGTNEYNLALDRAPRRRRQATTSSASASPRIASARWQG